LDGAYLAPLSVDFIPIGRDRFDFFSVQQLRPLPNDVMGGERGTNVVMRTRSDWYPSSGSKPISTLLTSSHAAMVRKFASNAIWSGSSSFLRRVTLQEPWSPSASIRRCTSPPGRLTLPEIAPRQFQHDQLRYQALGLGVVIWVAAATHRTLEAASTMPWFPESALLASSRCQRAPSSLKLSRTAFSS